MNVAGFPVGPTVDNVGSLTPAFRNFFLRTFDRVAPLDSPALTGTPVAPTAAPGTDTTQIATTAFVTTAVAGIMPANAIPLVDATPGVIGVSARYARQDHAHPTDTSRYAASNPSGYQTAANVTATLASPPAIGGTAPAAGTFSTLVSNGQLTVTDPSTNNAHSLRISATASSSGAGIELIGNGATTPNKYILSIAGQLQFVNSNFTVSMAVWDDIGNMTLAGSLTTGGPIQVSGGIGATSIALSGSVAQSSVMAGPAGAAGAPTQRKLGVTDVTGAAASGANADITSLSAPALGAATATTQASSDNSTKVATTAFTAARISATFAAPPAIGSTTPAAGTFSSLASMGQLTITDPSTNNANSLLISATSSSSGAGIKLTGNGSTTPSKYILSINGQLQLVNSNFTISMAVWDDVGNMTLAQSLTTGGPIQAAGGIKSQITGTTSSSYAGYDLVTGSANSTAYARLYDGATPQLVFSTGMGVTGGMKISPGVGNVTIADPTSAGLASLLVSATGNANGASIKFTGNGSTTPNKTIRVISGTLQVANSAYSSVLLSLDDSGNTLLNGSLGTGGPVTITSLATSGSAVIVSNTTNASGVNIQLTGNGSTTPTKYIRVQNGSLQVSNNNYSVSIFSLDDSGNMAVTGGIGAFGHTPPALQPAAPVTLADVIAIIRGCGLSA